MILTSPFESCFYGLNFGRVNQDEISMDIFLKEARAKAYDIVRVKISAQDREIASKFSGREVPCFFGGMIQKFSMSFKDYTEKKMTNESIQFVPFSLDRIHDFRLILISSFSFEAAGYYKIPWTHRQVTSEAEANLWIDYLISNLREKPDSHKAWFACLDGQYVGLIASTYDGDEGDVLAAGVIPSMRKKGVFRDLVRFIQNDCLKRSLRIGFAGARAHNLVSQRVFLEEGMTPCGNHLVFYLFPLFGLQMSKKEKTLVDRNSLSQQLPFGLLNPGESLHPGMRIENIHFQSYQNSEFISYSESRLEFDATTLLVKGFFDRDENLTASAWIELSSHVSQNNSI